MQNYHINILYSEEDGGYIADIPDLEACSAFGETPAKALEEVQKAKELWLQAATAEGKPIPVPRYRPVIYQVGYKSSPNPPDPRYQHWGRGFAQVLGQVLSRRRRRAA